MGKSIEISDTIRYPRPVVYRLYRDHLDALVGALDDIASFEVLERREEGDGVVVQRNLWQASAAQLPVIARPLITARMLSWYDDARWDSARWTCAWRTTLRVLGGAVTCRGCNAFTDQGARTGFELRGEVVVDARRIPGVPRALEAKVSRAIASVIHGVMSPNMCAVNRCIERHLDARGGEEAGGRAPSSAAG